MCSGAKLRVEWGQNGAAEAGRPGPHLPARPRLCHLGQVPELLWASISPSVKWGQDRRPRTWHTVTVHAGGAIIIAVVTIVVVWPVISAGLFWEPG